MNNDGSVELKQVERIFNTPGILYVDAYQRRRYKPTPEDEIKGVLLADQPTPLDELRKDFTRPIWSCKMIFAPNVVLGESQEGDPSSLVRINELMQTFATRIKSEQEDESSMKINLDVRQLPDSKPNKIEENVKTLTTKLISLVKKERCTAQVLKADASIEDKNEKDRMELAYKSQYERFDKFYVSVILKSSMNMMEPLTKWIARFDSYLSRTEDSETTSTLFAVMPRVGLLSLAVHPLLLAIYQNMRQQVIAEEQRRKSNSKGNPPKPVENSNDQRFPENKMPCSRIVFINLDGYESEFNIDVARTFNRHLMYISFPREWSELPEKDPQKPQNESEQEKAERLAREASMRDDNCRRRVYSQRMLKKYFFGGTDTKGWEDLLSKMYQCQPKQANRNIFVMPIHSTRMNKIIQSQRSSEAEQLGCIQQYESNFIFYIFKELLCNQISDFNPSLVVISYSGKLCIEDRHFAEMMKELTKLGNYKVMLFPNLTKSYMFENCDSFEYEQFFQSMYTESEKSICLSFPDETINVDLLQKMSIFLKITSGTYNLNSIYEEESFVEKYRNGKILAYVSYLMDQLKKEYDTINKVHFRSGELIAISKIIGKGFQQKKYEALFKSTVGKYHLDLIQQIKEMLADESPESYFNQLQLIHEVYPGASLNDVFESFQFEYQLQVSMQRFYKRALFTMRKPGDSSKSQHRTLLTLMSPQFEVVEDNQTYQLEIGSANKLLYDRDNRNGVENPLLYVTNVLFKFKGRDAQQFYNFVGLLKKGENRVQLHRVHLQGSDEQPYKILTNWNYHQTREHVYWYWPQRFDMKSWILLNVAGRSYAPEIEDSIFRASVSSPSEFKKLRVRQLHKDRASLPRYGCSSYSTNVNGQTHIYIFGGFYCKEDNYMKFQNSVDRFTVDGSSEQAVVCNVSKGRKIDAVRPRIYYDILQLDPPDKSDKSTKKIALVGGYGKNFSRPYCAMSSVWYRVDLSLKNPDEIIVKRELSKHYPINIPRPIRVRAGTKIEVLQDDESRTLKEQYINSDGYTFHHYSYEIKDCNVIEKPVFEFGLVEHEIYRDEAEQLRKAPQDIAPEDTKLRFHRNGNRGYGNMVTLFIENLPYFFEMKFEVPHEVKQKHRSIQEVVHITTQSIISVANFQTFIYVLLRDPVFTLNRCVLAQFHMISIHNVVIAETDNILKLQELHRFRSDVSNHALIVLKAKQIAVLHGPRHSARGKAPAEFILKKTRTINDTAIKECPYRLNPQPIKGYSKPLLSATAFVKVNDVVHCYSFATVGAVDLHYLHLQLSLSERDHAWQLTEKKEYKLTIQIPERKMTLQEYVRAYDCNHIQLVEVKLLQQQPPKATSPSEVVVTIMLRNRKYELRPLVEKETQVAEFKAVQATPEQQRKQQQLIMQIPKENEKEPIVIDKTWQFWEQALPEPTSMEVSE